MIRGYKGFESDMSCRGLKYEIGKTYVYRQKILLWNRSISLCERGFHFCRNMADVLSYYDGHDCRYAEVEALGEVIDGEDKSVTDKIRIVRELSWKEVLKEMAACAGLGIETSPFPADEVIQARENGTLDDLLPSGTEFPVRFDNGEWNVLVACRDRDHTYLVTKYLMAKTSAMNTGWMNRGGWPASDMRKYVREIYGMLPKDIKKAVIPLNIKRTVQDYFVECEDMAFLLSDVNVFSEDVLRPGRDFDLGDTQIDIFREPTARIKKRLGASSASWWWLRSVDSDYDFSTVTSNGYDSSTNTNFEGGVVVGFCIESRG